MRNCIIQLLCALSFLYAWDGGSIQVDITKSPMNIRLSADSKTLCEITSFQFGSTEISSISSETTSGNNLILELGSGKQIQISKVKNGIRLYCESPGVPYIKIIAKDQGDHFWGITEQNINDEYNPDLRGKEVKLSVPAYNGNQQWAQAWSAFYMSNLGYGSFYDTFAKGVYRFGMNNQTTIEHRTDRLDWYIFYGPTGDKIHEGYFDVIENIEQKTTPKKLPVWACGPCFWRDEYSSKNQVLEDASRLNELRIPMTFFLLDRPYSNGEHGYGQMDFNSNFSNPAQWIGTLNNDYNLKVITWIMPGTFGDTPCQSCFGGEKTYTDLSDPSGYNWYKNRIKSRQHTHGVQGHKMDRGDEEPPTGNWHDGTPEPERAQKFQYLNAKVTGEMLEESYGDDHFNFARSTYHRSQPYLSAVWNGDSHRPWNGLKGSIANAIRSSFQGYPVWASDCGGFNSAPSEPEQLLRWISLGLWSGYFEIIFENKTPWEGAYNNADFQAKYRRICEKRMELLPYIYSIANTSDKTGVMMRPMAYMYPHDPETYTIWDQYLFGPAFLVAPIHENGNSRSVYLPEGTWFNYYNITESNTGGQRITAHTNDEHLPVFVKSNSIYVSGRIYDGSRKKWDSSTDRNIIIHAFPGENGEAVSFDYVDYLDNNNVKTINLNHRTDGQSIALSAPSFTTDGSVKIRMEAQPDEVYSSGTRVSSIQYSDKILTVDIQKDQPIDIQIGDYALSTSRSMSRHGITKYFTFSFNHGNTVTIPFSYQRSLSQKIKIEIFDLHGRLLLQKNLNGSQNNVILDKFNSGSIILSLTHGNTVKTVKTVSF